VSIPVRLYPATSPRDPRFHLVDRQTGRRIRHRRVVEEPVSSDEEQDEEALTEASASPERPTSVEREVPYSEVARGLDVGEGRQVVVDQEDLEALRPEPSRAIEIEHFVALSEVDPLHFEKSYYLAPADEMAEKPYALLRVAMERSGRVAIGRFVLRSREHLVLIRPTAGILGLETMYYADEVRSPPGSWPATLASVEGALSPAEIDMAEQLILALAAEWDPAQYQDPYRERVLDLIRSAAPQDQPEPAAEAGASVADLMAVLRASVEAARDARGSDRPPRRRKAGGQGRR
jgi:DNA end-binding protein Ku